MIKINNDNFLTVIKKEKFSFFDKLKNNELQIMSNFDKEKKFAYFYFKIKYILSINKNMRRISTNIKKENIFLIFQVFTSIIL